MPAWAYGGFLFCGDLLGLAGSHRGGGVAYAAHVGGFLFGVAVALALRFSGLGARLRPEDEPAPDTDPVQVSAILATESGNLVEADRLWREVLELAPQNRDALLSLARIAARRRNAGAATQWVERLLDLLASAGDETGARGLLAELGHEIDAARVSPATAYRVSVLLRDSDPFEAERFERIAERDVGLVGLKARMAVAERLAPFAPEKARLRAEAVLDSSAAPPELRDRATSLLSRIAPEAAAAPADSASVELDFRDRFLATEVVDAPGVPEAESPRMDAAGAPGGTARMVVSGGADAPRCTRHPGARAGWHCRACDALLCPGCSAARSAGQTAYVVCARCGALAEVLLVHRRERWGIAERLRDSFRFTVRPGALMTLGAFAFGLWVLDFLGALGFVLAVGVAFGTFFQVVRSASNGDPDFHPFGIDEIWEDLFAPIGRGLVATMPLWIVLGLHAEAAAYVAAHPADALVAWILLPLDVVVALYVPAALVLPACGARLRHVMDPVMVVRTAMRLGRDYAVTAACLAAMLLVELAVVRLSGAVGRSGVPFLSAWLGIALASYVPVVAARLLGLLLWVRGDELGLGIPESYLEPALPNAVPRGRLAA
jgi:hypothetical protein